MLKPMLKWLAGLMVRAILADLAAAIWLGRVAMYLAVVAGLVVAGLNLESWWIGLEVGGVLFLIGLLFGFVAARLLVGFMLLLDDAEHIGMARFLPPIYGPRSRAWHEWEKERSKITGRAKATLALQAAIGFVLNI